jgi:hypothetical protein
MVAKMPGRLLSLIDNQVDWVRSDDSETITVSDFDISIVRKATIGTGVFYFYDEGWNSELSFRLESALVLSPGPMQASMTFDRLARFPSSGVITRSDEGYLIAPTLKIEVSKGSNIAIMLLSPRSLPYHISADKPALFIPNEANVAVSTEEGALHCTGAVSSSKIESAKLILNRNPNLPVYRSGYNQELCKLTSPGEVDVTWKPVAGAFEDCLLVFYPSTIGGDNLKQVAHMLGAPAPDDFGNDDQSVTIVGDGLFTDYELRLVVEHGFRRNLSDETRLTVT